MGTSGLPDMYVYPMTDDKGEHISQTGNAYVTTTSDMGL